MSTPVNNHHFTKNDNDIDGKSITNATGVNNAAVCQHLSTIVCAIWKIRSHIAEQKYVSQRWVCVMLMGACHEEAGSATLTDRVISP